MTDRAEASSPEQVSNRAREALLAAVPGMNIARRGVELIGSTLLPALTLIQTDSLTESPGDESRPAINRIFERGRLIDRLAIAAYSRMPGFQSLGDESRSPTNTRAFDLTIENLALDRDAAPTIDEDGRTVAVRLPNPADRSYLAASLIFPFGYRDAERTMSRPNSFWSPEERESTRALADYFREGHRLAMKRDGFEVTEAGVKRLARAGLTAGEQLKLDCLTFKVLTAKETPSPFEQQALTEAVGRLNRTLAADNPDEFVRKWRDALALCRNENDRRVFLMGVAGLLSDPVHGSLLIASFNKWFHTPTFADQWRRAMTELGNPQDQAAFQSVVNIALGQRPREGRLAGLSEALNDPRHRPDGDRTKPADPKKLEEMMVAAATDRRSSRPRPLGEFGPQSIGLQTEARPSWWKNTMDRTWRGITVMALVDLAERFETLGPPKAP